MSLPPMKGVIGCALLIAALALTAGSTHAFAQRLACSTIRPGETATHVARRITGDARNRFEPWFQIVDPGASRFIAKAQYDRIRPGWRACIVSEPVRTESLRVLADTAVATRMNAVLDDIVRIVGGIDSTYVLWGALVILISIGWRSVDEYVTDRHTMLDAMNRFGQAFILEFERPLIQQDRPERPIQSRLRAIPHRRRLEILLASNGAGRYPNLSDHKKNVEYDVTRVLQLLRDQPFACGPLYAQGPWVVVPFALQISSKQAGGK